ncbi:MAG: ATP-dependent DNA ligase [Patescibacteria group bacterium]|jgi:DNA ligase-1
MRFSEFSKYLEKLEATTKRLEITTILSKLIKELDTDEIDKGIYLSLGYLKAPFEKENFNIADKMMIRIIATAYDKREEEVSSIYNRLGDLGDTALEFAPEESAQDPKLLDVYQSLMEIAVTQGSGSQDTKTVKTSDLLLSLNGLSAKYVIRIILGTTRLGFTELTIIDALSDFLGQNKDARVAIEEKYNMHPDIGLISKYIKKDGLKSLDKVGMETGVPVLAQKPQRLSDTKEIIQKMEGTAWAEYKLDGTRVQLHLDRGKKSTEKASQTALFGEEILVRTFTRNLEETTHQFPDIVEAAKDQINAESVILDGEAIGYDKKTGNFLTFQEIIKRKRKYDIGGMAKEIPLKYFVFDVLYRNGKALMDLPLVERRQILNETIKPGGLIEVDYHEEITDPDELMSFFERSKEKGLEGLVIKNPKSTYQAGARSFSWIKMKKGDSDLLADDFDCVILGYYFGKGSRSSFGIGGFLAGVYDVESDTFKSLTKVGTGLKDEDFAIFKQKADKISVDKKPENVDVKKGLYPDVWVRPEILVVLKADEITVSPAHTSGYALRFPRFIGYREDKKPQDTTNTKEIDSLYKDQKRGYY